MMRCGPPSAPCRTSGSCLLLPRVRPAPLAQPLGRVVKSRARAQPRSAVLHMAWDSDCYWSSSLVGRATWPVASEDTPTNAGVDVTGAASPVLRLSAARARAGNYGSDSDVVKDTPTNFGLDIMVSVAASDLQDAIPAYSNFGPGRVHLAAPGSEILSTVPSERYYVLSGARRPRSIDPVVVESYRLVPLVRTWPRCQAVPSGFGGAWLACQAVPSAPGAWQCRGTKPHHVAQAGKRNRCVMAAVAPAQPGAARRAAS